MMEAKVQPMKKKQHGGKRTPGPGKKLGRPTVHGVAKINHTLRLTPDVKAFLLQVGNGAELIEGLVRRSKAFQEWSPPAD